MKNNLNVFDGENSVLDYLNPDNNPHIPLVELPDSLNPFVNQKVRIFAKMMNTLPLANVKSLPAYNMLTEAQQRGELQNIDTLIENSSGNTVFSLAIIGKLLGINSTKAVVSNEVSTGKLQMLRVFGTEIIVNTEPICPDPSDKTSGIYKAKVWAQENKWLNVGQYDNSDNPQAHEKWTGKQIWEQTQGDISVFCCGLGTTGTMVGAGRYLKKHNQNIQNVGVARLANNPVPGPRTKNLLREIAFDWKGVVDSVQEIGTIDSFKLSLDLCRNGLVVGPSSGFILKGLLDYIQGHSESGTLDTLRNKHGEIVCVFICCDSPFPYINEYFEYLDDSHFPVIENEELLNNQLDVIKKTEFSDVSEFEIKVEDTLEEIQNEKVIVLDIRKNSDFNDFHIFESQNVEYNDLEKWISESLDDIKDKKVIVVCYRGNSSKLATSALRNLGIDAFSMSGGMLEWSKRDFPRWKPDSCKI